MKASLDKKLSMTINCGSHKSEWKGHVQCPGCLVTYHVHVEDEPPCSCGYDAPRTCDCGVSLIKRGRAVCSECFVLTKTMVAGGQA